MSFLFSKNKKQLEAIFDWLSVVVNQNDLILVEREGKQEGYYFEFPLRFGDKPKKLKRIEDKDFTCLHRRAFLIKFSPCQRNVKGEEWKLIFQSPELEVYESKKRFEGKQFKPLRWGLDEEEKRTALKIARESIEIFLKEKRTSQIKDFNFPLVPAFALRTDLDVAFWVNGALRGSAVVENTILSEGIIKASIYATRDSRFKPLEFDELKNTRIEITLFSDLKILLSKSLLDKNEIFHDKGYLLKRGEKQGWFLPEVFNVLSFKNLKEFLFHLGTEKAFLQLEEIFDKHTEFFVFEVDDFIEGGEKEEILSLAGPMARIGKSEGEIKKTAISAADWLLKMQEPDGNFIPIINPLTGKCSQLDWPRSIFTGWSLIEFGKSVDDPKYIEAARKNFFYGKKYVLDEQIIKNPNSECLDLAYLGQEALSLGYREEVSRCGNRILEKENQLKFEPILFSQIGSFLAELSRTDKNFMVPALRFGEKTQLAFDNALRQKSSMQLAVWAELANLYLKLFEIQGDISHLQTVRKVVDWLLSYQLDDGSFRATSNGDSNFAYTRGTAKIAEVLAEIFVLEKQIDGALDLVYYKKCFEKTFSWLEMMQYSPENSYFIPKKNLDLIIGGFRHDYFNQEAWIDSAGHFLLAVSRFLKHSDS